jgi:drug/metabolite transporter (DMT)-like permease
MAYKLTTADIFALMLTTIMWALSFPFIKIGLEYYPPIMLGALRYCFGALPIILLLMIHKDFFSETKILFVKHWKLILAVGIFMVTIPNIAQNIGMQYTSASLSTLIQSVGPVFTVALAIIILKETATPYKILGTILALSCAILLIFQQGIDFQNITMYGNVLQLITAVSYGINGLFGKMAVDKITPIVLVGWSMFVGSIILFPISIVTESQTWVHSISTQGLYVLGFLTLFPALIATLLWYIVLKKQEVSRQILFIYLLPFFAIIFSYFLLGEVISYIAMFLGILTIIGVGVAQRE